MTKYTTTPANLKSSYSMANKSKSHVKCLQFDENGLEETSNSWHFRESQDVLWSLPLGGDLYPLSGSISESYIEVQFISFRNFVVLCLILENSKTAFDGGLKSLTSTNCWSKNFNKVVEVRDLSLLSDTKHDEHWRWPALLLQPLFWFVLGNLLLFCC